LGISNIGQVGSFLGIGRAKSFGQYALGFLAVGSLADIDE
jgi:hypothetical protein